MVYRIPIIKGRKGVALTEKKINKVFENFINKTKHTISSEANRYKSFVSKEDLVSEIVINLYNEFDKYNSKLITAHDFTKSIIKKTLSDFNIETNKSLNSKKEIKGMIKSISKVINANIVKLPKKAKIEDIRIRQRSPKIFQRSTMRTISISKALGIKAVIGQLPKDPKIRVQTLIFNRDSEIGKSWGLQDAKQWVKQNKNRIKISVDVKELLNKIGV